MRFLATALTLTAALAFGSASASDASTDPRPPLRDVPQIDGPMLWVAMAIEISDKCPEIDPRNLKGLLVLHDLRGKALDLGYTKDEIEDYATSKQEKARMRELGEQYVKSQGLDPEKTADLCMLGKTEIARNSQIGVLLKAK